MVMTEEQIRKSFEEASNKKNQLRVLADMNVCSVREIKETLGLQPPKAPMPEVAKNVIYATLDSIEAKIKQVETQLKELEEYKKTLEKDYTDLAKFMEVKR